VAAGNAYQAKRNFERAVEHYRLALAIDPDDAATRHNFGSLLLLRGESREAISHLQQEAALSPDRMETHANLALALGQTGQWDQSLIEYRQAMRLGPDHAPTMAGAARILATHPEATRRNAQEAIQLAERAVQVTSQRDAMALDALAAAYACAGIFDKAVAAQQASIKLANAGNATTEQIADLQSRLALYRQRKPFVAAAGDEQLVQLKTPPN
jgi:tetratricopeptide (TPR) repeat protein